jgi:AmpD protein
MPLPDLRTGVNDFSIGIELVATALSGFTDAQYASLGQLCNQLQRTQAHPFAFWGHEDVAGEKALAMGLRADIKLDPGPLFDWPRLGRLVGKKGREHPPVQGRI